MSQVFYHATPTRLVTKILKEGLKPKTSRLESISGAPTKGRVYLAYYQDDLRELLGEFRRRGRGKEPFTLLEVRIPKNGILYEDEDTFGSETFVYSISRIPPRYISVVGPITDLGASLEQEKELKEWLSYKA